MSYVPLTQVSIFAVKENSHEKGEKNHCEAAEPRCYPSLLSLK